MATSTAVIERQSFESLDDVQDVLTTFTPEDLTIGTSKLRFHYVNDRPGFSIPKRDSTPFLLSDHSFSQFVTNLDRKASPSFIKSLSSDTQERVINELISRTKRPSLFIRMQPEVVNNAKEVIGVLTDYYQPVNHSKLLSLVPEIQQSKFARIELSASWDYMFLRLPIKAISTEGKGTFFGIQFSNGQTGMYNLSISALIWELICTNGATMRTDHGTFVHRKHMGDVSEKLSEFKQWGNDAYKFVNTWYNKTRNLTVPNASAVITDFPKKYPLITKKLAEEILSYVKHNDTAMRKDVATAWSISRGITWASQKLKEHHRYDVDGIAFSIIEDLINKKNA